MKTRLCAVLMLSAVTLQAATTVVQTAGGDEHTLFIKSDGSLWGMGDNFDGQLGLGQDLYYTNVPQLIVASNVTAAAAGAGYSLFLKTDGSLWGMGANSYGQLGDNSTTFRFTPELLVPGGVTAIAANNSAYTSLFLKSDGSLWGMGNDDSGQLGDGANNTIRSNAVMIVSGGVTAMAAGYYHSLFVKSDGSLWAMGDNYYGELGNGTTNNSTNVPEMIVPSGVTAVAAGFDFSLFVKSNGSLWAMGLAYDGQLGDGAPNPVCPTPEQIEPGGVTAIAAGFEFTLFRESNGSLWATGYDQEGQLGDGNSAVDHILYRYTPEQIVTSNVSTIAAGESSSLFTKSDGSLWGMGYDGYGQLGSASASLFALPTQILPDLAFTAMPTNGLVPLTVQFNSPSVDNSGNAITSWNWNFGDGVGTSTNQNPWYIYTNTGTFNPTLVAINGGGDSVAGAGPSINVATTNIRYTASPISGYAPLTVYFTSPNVDQAGISISLWSWNFGDGSTSGLQNPSHTYLNPGHFAPSLFATNILNNTLTGLGPTNLTAIFLGVAPTITTQPMSLSVASGATAIFSVAANGTAPLSYYWYENGASIADANDSAYTLNDVPLADSGSQFFCLVSNAYGSATSCVVTLTVGVLPTITTQPANLAVLNGGTATFDVTASGGGPLTFQWQFNGTNLPGSIINTVAGGSVGDGRAATNASLNNPEGVAADRSGNLFIVDTFDQRVRKVDTHGLITTVAGNGVQNYSGDGGPATNASLNNPQGGLAVDSSGNLFIADSGNNLIRKVDTNGLITTVAGGGGGSDGGLATNASLNYPEGVAVDASGNLFIADTGNDVIRKVDPNGIITTVAGNGNFAYSGDGGPATSASLNSPHDVTVDACGNLFIADTANTVIREVDPNGIITTVAGNGNFVYSGDGGAATNASLNSPQEVRVDASGNLFIADTDNSVIRMVNTNGIITTVAGNGNFVYTGDGGPATNASLNYPAAVAVDASGNLFIADTDNNRVRGVATNGVINTVAGGNPGDGRVATAATLNYPEGMTVDLLSNLFIADSDDNLIRKVGANGIITTVAGNGTYSYSGDGGPATNASLDYPAAVAVDASGNLFIADTENSVIRMVNTNGIITTVAGNGNTVYSGDGGPAINASLDYPGGVAVGASGNLFIADTDNSVIRMVNTNGIITTVAGNGNFGYSGDGGAATQANLNYPDDVTVDSSGNLFIADTYNSVIRKVGANGIITTVAGNGTYGYSGDGGAATNASLNYPAAVRADASGNLFIADSANSVIREAAANGIITTVAGNGTYGYSGDGGAATNASLDYPEGVAVNASGNLFIADSGNNRVRAVTSTTGAALTLTLASLGNAGGYDVVVSGSFGSVTSTVATLTVSLTPSITIVALGYSSNGFLLNGLAPTGYSYIIEASTNLASWAPIGTNPVPLEFLDLDASNHAARFYRAVLVP